MRRERLAKLPVDFSPSHFQALQKKRASLAGAANSLLAGVYLPLAPMLSGHASGFLPMTTTTLFPYAGLLDALETSGDPGAVDAKAATLIPLLKAYRATLQAASDTTLAADELRRYQKYAKPGKPSAHIVQLRQKQAAARQATSIARQSLIKAAAVYVREAAIDVPERMPLDAFITGWINANLPKDADTSA
ncbi:hypothetical protein DyAD56_06295 [Dyella sp. AD56]|nr:hypothetical protein DyAD56_06295 [Dyella sp. AD56]